MAHPVVHFQISGPDDRQLADFYASLFGWRMQPVPGVDYTLIDTGAAGINGGIEKVTDARPVTTFYIETDDLQSALDKINLVGGKTVTPITELPGMATYAIFEDIDGLAVGLVLGAAETSAAGQPQAVPSTVITDSAGGVPVDWFEVLGTDAKRSQQFYAEIFGWQLGGAAQSYGMVDTGTSRGIRGGIGAGEPGPWVTVYASVGDVAAVLARATELGGSRVHGPVAVDDHMQTGALRDPAGNVVGVYHHAPH
jgi:predicted enzyme related to lactoylglutathione lyase